MAGTPSNLPQSATEADVEAGILGPGHTFGSVTDKISSIVLQHGASRGWWVGFMISFSLVMLLLVAITYLFVRGVGVWGINIPIAWGFAIVNFVWWVGIGHAGTLISAILLLLHQEWRTSINRFAEAMTLFAVACAGLFPLLHMGRPWFAYWLFPYPNTMNLWPQFRSPLVWDAFAVSTYFTVSLLFWYVGLVPDMATLRDKSRNRFAQIAYGFFAMGWRGSARHWRRHEVCYLILAGLATPLVVSVHTVVSFDFAVANLPGWHTTIFPPYFVAGAIYSGFAMVVVLAIPLRYFYGLQDFITDRHLQNMAKVMLATCMIVGYGYGMEAFFAWYSGNLVRSLSAAQSHVRRVRLELLDAHRVQRRHPATPVVGPRAPQHSDAVLYFDRGSRRHVARTICDRHHKPAARFSAIILGNVLTHVLGLGHVHRLAWFVLQPPVSIRSHPAGDLDV